MQISVSFFEDEKKLFTNEGRRCHRFDGVLSQRGNNLDILLLFWVKVLSTPSLEITVYHSVLVFYSPLKKKTK